MSVLGRIPLRAISYNNKEEAVPEELIIDYDNGNIYVKSSDGSTCIDLTKALKDKVSEIAEGDVTVTLNGNKLDLNEALREIDIKASGLQAEEAGRTFILPSILELDLSSLSTKNNKVQIKGFDEATPGYTIMKTKLGELVWVPHDLSQNPTDGMRATVHDIITQNDGNIYLMASNFQRTTNISVKSSVILPSTIDEYTKIVWKLITNDNTNFTFPSNIEWEYNAGNEPKANFTQIYEFETWDFGKNWYGRVRKVNSDMTVSTAEEIASLYYNKSEVDQKLQWVITK